MNTTEFLSIATLICPDKVAIVFEGKRYIFSQLNGRVKRLGNALSNLGIQKGDRIAMLQVNCSQCVEVYFAVAELGGIYVPLNFRCKGNELTYMLNSAEANTLFVGERYIDLINSIKPDLASVKNFVSIESQCEGMLSYEEMIASSPADEIFTEINDDETAILVYTAGTTGFPKGVMLSHNSFTTYVLENVDPAAPELEEKNILTVPLYHVAGIQAMMAAVYGGRTLVIERQFEPKEWMELVEVEKVNRAMMVPTMLKQVMDHPDFTKHDLSSLKVITYGADRMPLEVIKKAVDIFPGVSFINAFGQTETASTITTLSPKDHNITGTEEEKEKKLKRLSSIGKPMSDVEMKVIDEEGNALPVGQVGEVVARGPRVMAGYWKDQEKTEETIDKEGWVHTGDMGYVDEDGYFFLVGRATDMIVRGGENISPEEVEAVLYSHSKVDDAAVFGAPDEEWGEVPMCVIVLKEGETATAEELMEHCRDLLASYKRPRSVVFVDELPRNPMGKVLKRVLREQHGKAFNPRDDNLRGSAAGREDEVTTSE
ncbi:class I adenylate-forming enzyme family protein [Chloroflexota bacterium]